jgi:hypothetical protein
VLDGNDVGGACGGDIGGSRRESGNANKDWRLSPYNGNVDGGALGGDIGGSRPESGNANEDWRLSPINMANGWSEVERLLRTLPLTECKRAEINGVSSAFGLTSTGGSSPQLIIGKSSRLSQSILQELNVAICGLPGYPPGFLYTSLQVGRNQIVKKHCDSRNMGLSVSFSLGKFTGGMLVVDDVPHYTCKTILQFDGRRPHYVTKFSGERISVVAYTHSLVGDASASDTKWLEDAAFPAKAAAISPPVQRIPVVLIARDDVKPAEPLAKRRMVTNLRPATSLVLTILYLFSGKAGIPNSFASACEQIGTLIGVEVCVVEFDFINSPDQDLLDDRVWNLIVANIKSRHYDAAIMAPPCDTHGCRRRDEYNVSELRDVTGPGIYGRSDLSPGDKDKVRKANLLGIRSSIAANLFISLGIPWLLEQPTQRTGRPHLFRFTEFTSLLSNALVLRRTFPQCHVGSKYMKETDIIMYKVKLSPVIFPESCTHKKIWYREVPSGRYYFAAHPTLKGKVESVKSTLWRDDLFSFKENSAMPWLTKAAASYPSELNMAFARSLVNAALDVNASRGSDVMKERLKEGPAAEIPEAGAAAGLGTPAEIPEAGAAGVSLPSTCNGATGPVEHTVRKTMEQPTPLRGTVDNRRKSEIAADFALGGLRNARMSVLKCPSIRASGSKISALAVAFLSGPANDLCYRNCLEAIGSKAPNAGPAEADLLKFRAIMCKALGVDPGSHCHSPMFPTEVFHVLLEAWRLDAKDPETEVAKWFQSGAPMGLSEVPKCCGIFPQTDEADSIPDVDIEARDPFKF